MKSEMEIRNKIDQLFDFVEKVKGVDSIAEENARCQIDMLLWVIGDKSGWSPIDERRYCYEKNRNEG